jgi:hypothetical protein
LWPGFARAAKKEFPVLPYLNKEEIRALNSRRELLFRYIQKLIELAGEANVLF